MKNKLLTLILLFSFFSYSQVGINTDSPDPSAALDINSQKTIGFGGLKLPVVADDTERGNINTSVNDTGLLIFNQASNCIEIYDGDIDTWYPFDNCNATVFEEGDFMFTSVQSVNPDQFSIIPLKNVAAGQRFYITDCGIQADDTFRTNEGLMYWDVTTPILARTEITFTSDGVFPNGSWSVSIGTVTVFNDPSNLYGTSFDIGNVGPAFTIDGDQIIFFTATDDTDPMNNVDKFVTALSLENSWNSGATNTSDSKLPPGLSVGVDASTLDTNGNNKSLICNPGLATMNDAMLRAYISDTSNWNHDNVPANVNIPSGCSF